MSIGLFIGVSLIWTGMLAGAAELMTRGASAPFARQVWRGAAFLMVLPWLTAGAAYMWPSAVSELPIPAMLDFALAETGAGLADEGDVGQSILPVSLATLLIGILATGWALRFLCAARAQWRLQSLKSSASPATGTHLMRTSEQWADRAGIRAVPRVMEVEHLASPFTAGIREARIYLPSHLIGKGHEDMIIAHESIHIARGDQITRPFERAVADLLWFSPFAWLARRRLDYLREASCDAKTIALTGSPKAYARALVDVARQQTVGAPLPVAAFILRDKGSLKRRVSSVMNAPNPSPARMGWAAGLVALLAVPLALAQGIKANGPSDVFTHPIVMSGKISSTFGERKDPWTGELKWHKGIDIAAPLGDPVMTPAPGKVVFADYKPGYGNVVMVQLEDGRQLLFGQLKKIKVKKGTKLKAGEYVGLLGESGRATGPHLHFEVHKPYMDEKSGKTKFKPYDPQRFDIDFIAN